MNKMRVLAIEDDVDVAELLVMFFQGQGYEVFHADSGVGGISLARAKLPNVILLDIMLPDMEGFDVCRELRSANLTRYIPTIFLTQRNSRADKVSGLELGADDYITKPFDIEELRVRVQKSIHRATRDHLHEEITGLPTGPLVDDQHIQFMQGNATWHRLDVHIAGFDAFRDVYGFLTANDALNLATNVLSGNVVRHGTPNDFIGFVEPGYFVIFTYSPKFEQIIDQSSYEFQERAAALYRFTDVDQGFVEVDDGSGSPKQMPLMHFDIQTQTQASVAS